MTLEYLPVPELESPGATLVTVLCQRAETLGDQRAYVFLAEGEAETEVWSYADLDRRARAIAVELANSGIEVAGKPVLVCAPPGLDYIAGFFGCLYAGAIAVPANPPDPIRLDRTLPRFRSILGDADAVAALSTHDQIEAAREVIERDLDLPLDRWLAVDRVTFDGIDTWQPPDLVPADPAFLMYTSGSTAEPKGAVIGHGNALHNLSRFPGFANRPCNAVVSWLPFFHDLGLFLGILHPLYRSCPSILMPPAAMVRRPARWLEAMSRYSATTTGGPNFTFDLCVDRISPEERAALDLSAWNLALNGSEPVRWRTLKRFNEAFAECGFRPATHYPSFGMAEAAATVTGASDFEPSLTLRVASEALAQGVVQEVGEDDRGRVYVGCGPIIAEQRMEIVDPETCKPKASGEVGEIWVSGPSIGQSYWRRQHGTGNGLKAHLSTEPDGPVFLRTGDLGFIHRNELFITGRLKDLIILRGINYHPEDLEHTLAHAHARARPNCAAAFSLELDGREGMGIVQEINPRGCEDKDFSEIVAAFRGVLVEGYDIDPDVIVLIEPRTIPKTSSGKIQRRETARRFASGDLETLHEWHASRPTPSSGRSAGDTTGRSEATVDLEIIRRHITEHVARMVGVEAADVDVRSPFSRFGLASVESVFLIQELENLFDLSLRPTLAWEYPTVEQMAVFLRDQMADRRTAIHRGTTTAYREPIAIVGMSCRFPGAHGAQQLWELISAGHDAVDEVPVDRWDADQLHDPDPQALGKMVSRLGGFLPDLERFDAEFFGITPREAMHLDPRQRLLLESAWEALEDARIPAERLAGTRTGVFMAALANDYDHLLSADLNRIGAYTGAGTAETILANRLSYVLNLHGPSLTVNTACSGALVAIHLACQSLYSGESELALVGGVNLVLMPKGNIFFSKAGALSPDGRCKTFDADANGMVRSDGAGVVLLEPLSKALERNDPIYAVIRGSAVNSDGRSNGIMAPNGQAQERLLRDAYTQAGIDPRHVGYVEAHGTGTSVGDPIEMHALGAVLGADRSADERCRVGSIKTQVGHLEAAAGIAGLMKVALALHHATLPPQINFQRPNPLIPFDELGFAVQAQSEPWTRNGGPRVAGVSAFGFGGTNAHIIVEEAPRRAPSPTVAPSIEGADASAPSHQTPPDGVPQAGILPLSARSEGALQELFAATRMALPEPLDFHALCRSAALGRSHLEIRAAVVTTDSGELNALLTAGENGEELQGLIRSGRVPANPPSLAWVFSGQGAHWPGMGRDLLDHEPAFRKAVEACDACFAEDLGGSLIEWLQRPDPADDDHRDPTDWVQPAVFAVQVGLSALWRSWGIEPSLCVGQSLGEVAAAHVAGILTLEDAARVVLHRSRLMRRVEGEGATAVVGLTRDEAELTIVGFAGRLGVAGSNSPKSSVISGDPESLESLLEALAARDVFARRLGDVRVAFHSPQMDPLVDELVAALEGLTPRPASIPLVSTVTGTPVDGETLDAAYWGRHLRQPFLFADAIAEASRQGHGTFLEISPHPVLSTPMRETLKAEGHEGRTFMSLRRGRDPWQTLYGTLAELYCVGWDIRWQEVHGEGDRPVPLPPYPWQRETFWYDQIQGGARASTHGMRRTGTHPLLGEHVALAVAPPQHLWETDLEISDGHFIADHVVQGAVIFPGAAFLEMCLEATRQVAHGEVTWRVDSAEFERVLVLPAGQPMRLQMLWSGTGDDTATFQLASRALAEDHEGTWTVHTQGTLRRIESAPPQDSVTPEGLQAIRGRCAQTLAVADHYTAMANRGLTYGPRFQPLKSIARRDGESLGEIQLSDDLTHGVSRYRVHPVVLDALFQLVSAALPQDAGDDPFLPAGLQDLQLHRPPGDRVWGHVVLQAQETEASDDEKLADVRLLDGYGAPLLEIRSLRLQRLGAGSQQTHPEHLTYGMTWHEVDDVDPEDPDQPGTWLLFTDTQFSDDVAQGLEDAGETVVRVDLGDTPEEVVPARQYRVRSTNAEDLDQLFQTLSSSDLPPLRGVVYLWGLDQPPWNTEADPVEALRDRLWGSPLTLVQALGRLEGSRPRLWLVSRGAQSVSKDDPVTAEQALLWGLGRVISREHPEAWGGLIDLPIATSPSTVACLCDELLSGDDEDQVAYREDLRHVARIEPVPRALSNGEVALRPEAAYLVTGGFGGLGLEAAHLLVDHGARRLILVSRSPLPPRDTWRHSDDPKVAAVRHLESKGAHVEAVALDISDGDKLQSFLENYRREDRAPIRGVVHSAGVLSDALIMRLELGEAARVLAPKVAGASNLHRCLDHETLDFFVLYSSAASWMPPRGQAAYAAGNAFLDALARQRRANGQPAISLAWGPWADIGMAARGGLADRHRSFGVRPLKPAQGAELLEHALAGGPEELLILDADWPEVLRSSGPQRLLSYFAPRETQPATSESQTAGSEATIAGHEFLMEMLLQPDDAARQTLLTERLSLLTAAVMQVAPERFDADRSLMNLGMDSIMAVELSRQVEVDLGFQVSLMDLLKGVSVQQLAEQLLEPGPHNAGLQEVAAILSEVEDLDLLGEIP